MSRDAIYKTGVEICVSVCAHGLHIRVSTSTSVLCVARVVLSHMQPAPHNSQAGCSSTFHH